jgi:uncharacterized protein GlcG (DUF336 family)
MKITLDVDTSKLAAAFKKAPLAVARELRIEMGKAMQVVERDARMHHRFKTKSGSLERSIQHDTSKDGLYGRVFLNTGTAKYGPYQHDGTKPHVVRPTNRKALYFLKGGQKFFSKGHTVGGIKADKFMDKAFMRQKPYIIARIRGAIARAFQIAGLK